jgi:hypothetical protein
MTPRGIRILMTVAAIGLTTASNGVASVRARRQSWPTAYRMLHRSDRRALRARALHSGAPSRRARASIVGGSQIAITQAPWQVLVMARVPKPEEKVLVLLCGGSVTGESRIVTAGHCVFDPTTGLRVPAEDLFVVAGTADAAVVEPGEQEVTVASVRVHPGFSYALGAGAPDDVAILALTKPLTFNAVVRPLSLVATEAMPAEGAYVNLTGFGRQSPTGRPSGLLYSLTLTVGFSRPCGGQADAVFLCASAPGGSGCLGDSGGGLTAGSPPVLVGVMDTVEVISGKPCRAGSDNGFVNTAAPEIRDFIEGSESPPQAPRGGGAIVRAVPRVGNIATCEPGSWTGSPTFSYWFVDSASGQTLQSGPSAIYPLTAADHLLPGLREQRRRHRRRANSCSPCRRRAPATPFAVSNSHDASASLGEWRHGYSSDAAHSVVPIHSLACRYEPCHSTQRLGRDQARLRR